MENHCCAHQYDQNLLKGPYAHFHLHIFLILDSAGAALYGSQFKITFIYLTLGFGAAPRSIISVVKTVF